MSQKRPKGEPPLKLSLESAGDGKMDLPVSGQARGLDDGRLYAVAIKVARPGYEPPGVTVRARAGASVFTAEASGAALKELALDPLVVSISVSRPLPLID
jgi:hypothetical protein